MSNRRRSLVLPKNWTKRIRSAVLHVISVAKYAIVVALRKMAASPIARVWLRAEKDRLRQEVALLREELRIKDACLRQITPHQRPSRDSVGSD